MHVKPARQVPGSRTPARASRASLLATLNGSVYSLMQFLLVPIWGYPLAALCRRAGKPAAVGWIAGSIGVFFCGPLWCVWWLALSTWNPPPTKP